MMQRWHKKRTHFPILAALIFFVFIVCSILYNERSIQQIHQNLQQRLMAVGSLRKKSNKRSNLKQLHPHPSLEVVGGGGRDSFLPALKILNRPYEPYPVIGWNRHVETIFAAFFRSLPNVRFRQSTELKGVRFTCTNSYRHGAWSGPMLVSEMDRAQMTSIVTLPVKVV